MAAHAAQSSPLGANPVLFSRAQAVTSTASDETRTVDFVASDEGVDGHGTIVRQNWDLRRFQPRGVVLYAHDQDELPIGTATVRVADGKLLASVTFSTADLNPMAEQVWKNVKAGVLNGISAGFVPHTITCERQNDREILVLDDNELFELSVTPCPSNANALAQMRSMAAAVAPPVPTETEERGAVPYKAYPADDSGSWDGSAAVQRVAKWASSDGSGDKDTIDWAKYRSAFAWYDAANTETFGAYKLPHHDVVDGKLVTSRAGVIAAGNVMSGARGGASIPEGDVDAVKAHLAKHYAQFDMKAPWEDQARAQVPPPNDGPAVKTAEPINEEIIMADKPTDPTNTISVARALGLPVGATEQDAITAAVTSREANVQLVAITGAKSLDEALGSVRAMKEASDQLKAAREELAAVKAERDQQNFEMLIGQAHKDRKILPVDETFEREQFAIACREGRGAAYVERVRGWLKIKQPLPQLSRAVQPHAVQASTATPVAWNGKSYKELSYAQRARLAKEDPELFRVMKDDFEASQSAA